MQKFISFIIIFVSFFSIANFVNASDWEVSDILELKTGIQESDLSGIYIKTISLKTSKYRNKYIKMKEIDKVIKQEIFRKIEAEEFDYYTWFDVIKSYSSFIYSVNKLFEQYKYKEKWYDVDSNIKDTLFEINTYYKNLQYLVNKD